MDPNGQQFPQNEEPVYSEQGKDNEQPVQNMQPPQEEQPLQQKQQTDQSQQSQLERPYEEFKDNMQESFKKKLYECNGTACPKSIKQYESWVRRKLDVLKKKKPAHEGVGLLFGLPTIEREGKRIKGVLAYAGVSLNNRIYLPEELAKGDGKTLPLLLNHSNVAGAEEELDRLENDMKSALENGDDFQIGWVTLRWEPEELTLYYEGVIEHPFFQKEVEDADMAVSLGIWYDSDSPQVCDEECYTLIRGAEFREVSLVYHPGFPIATIEAVEVALRKRAKKQIAQEAKFDKHIENIDKLLDSTNNQRSFSLTGIESVAVSTNGGVSADWTFDANGGNTIFLSATGTEARLQPYMSLPKKAKEEIDKFKNNVQVQAPQDTMKDKDKADESKKKLTKNSKKKNTQEMKRENSPQKGQ